MTALVDNTDHEHDYAFESNEHYPDCWKCGFLVYDEVVALRAEVAELRPKVPERVWICKAYPGVWLTVCTPEEFNGPHLMAELGCGWDPAPDAKPEEPCPQCRHPLAEHTVEGCHCGCLIALRTRAATAPVDPVAQDLAFAIHYLEQIAHLEAGSTVGNARRLALDVLGCLLHPLLEPAAVVLPDTVAARWTAKVGADIGGIGLVVGDPTKRIVRFMDAATAGDPSWAAAWVILPTDQAESLAAQINGPSSLPRKEPPASDGTSLLTLDDGRQVAIVTDPLIDVEEPTGDYQRCSGTSEHPCTLPIGHQQDHSFVCPDCHGHPKRPSTRTEGGSLSCRHCNRTLTFNFMRDQATGGTPDCTCKGARDEACPSCGGSGLAAVTPPRPEPEATERDS